MKKVTSKRYHDLDFARAIPLLGLPFVHCYEEFESAGFLPGNVISWGQIFLYLCMLGPSVFMMGLGMNVTFTSHNSTSELRKRGIETIKVFFILNIFRYLIPGSIYGAAGHQLGFDTVKEFFFQSDILFFAGLAFLLFSLFKSLHFSTYGMLLTATLMLSVDMLIPNGLISNIVLKNIVGNFFISMIQAVFQCYHG